MAPRHLPAASSVRTTAPPARTATRSAARTRGVPTPPASSPTAPTLPDASAARPARAGFVLYVGLGDESTGAQLADLAEVAESLRDLARDLLPTAETYTALSLVPGTGADDVRDLRDRLSRLEPLAPGPAGTGNSGPDRSRAAPGVTGEVPIAETA